MKVTVSNKIQIEDYTQAVADYCRENLILPNPEFYKAEKLGRWTGNINREFVLYERCGNSLLLPFGCLKDVWKRFKNECSFESLIHDLSPIQYNSNINLYPYQETAVQRLIKAKNGVLVSKCGSGKTIMALETIARIGGRALWLTHTGELLTQSMERAKSCYGLSKDDYGTITAGKVNIGKAITFATVQTMSNIDVRQYGYCWDIVVVDEAHKCIGSPTKVMQFYKVLSNLQARYKIGVTATPKRSDGLERSMFALIGDIVHEIPKEEVERYTCPVKVAKIETGYVPDLDFVLAGDGTIVYSDLITDLTRNEHRNHVIATGIRSLLSWNKTAKILILSDRVEHLTTLKSKLADCGGKVEQLMALSNSKKQREERRKILKDLNDGDVNVVLATYALAKEGLDVPRLTHVVFASPQKDATTVEQSAGRVGRRADGKEYGTVIDYTDNGFGMLAGFSRKRNTVYRKLKYEIV